MNKVKKKKKNARHATVVIVEKCICGGNHFGKGRRALREKFFFLDFFQKS